MEVLNKRLVNSTPGKGTREEGGPFVILSKAGTTIRTDTCRQEVFIEKRIVETSQERLQRGFRRAAVNRRTIKGKTHIGIFRQIAGKVSSRHRLVLTNTFFKGDTCYGIELMDTIGIISSEQRLRGQTLPDAAGLTCLTVIG